jgi:hypothetical protein
MPKPKKVGRPKMAKGEAKGKIVPIRFNAEDRKSVEKTAKEATRNVSDLARVLMVPPISIGDTVTIDGRDGRYVVMAGWPGKPRYFVASEGSYPTTIDWSTWVDPNQLTLVKKFESPGAFRQIL